MVAKLAGISSRRMIAGFACWAADAVMTAGTVTICGYHTMVNGDYQPIGGVVAGIAGLRSGKVGGALARGDAAVVAGFTGGTGLSVVNRQRKCPPTRAGSMTAFAKIGCGRMRCRLIGGVRSDMTFSATVGCLGMIKRCDQG